MANIKVGNVGVVLKLAIAVCVMVSTCGDSSELMLDKVVSVLGCGYAVVEAVETITKEGDKKSDPEKR